MIANQTLIFAVIFALSFAGLIWLSRKMRRIVTRMLEKRKEARDE